MGILVNNFKVLSSKLLSIQFSNETMKVAIIFVLIATVFLVNTTSAGPVGSGQFSISSNQLTGNHHAKLSFIQSKIIEESKNINIDSNGYYLNDLSSHPASDLRKALVSEFKGRWYVSTVKADEFHSFSFILSDNNDYLALTYKGVSWGMFSY